jgi:hypothetical protein
MHSACTESHGLFISINGDIVRLLRSAGNIQRCGTVFFLLVTVHPSPWLFYYQNHQLMLEWWYWCLLLSGESFNTDESQTCSLNQDCLVYKVWFNCGVITPVVSLAFIRAESSCLLMTVDTPINLEAENLKNKVCRCHAHAISRRNYHPCPYISLN